MRVGFAMAVVAGLACCKADLPKLTDADTPLDTTCVTPHADMVVDFFPTSLANPAAALRAPDGMTVTLTKDNVLTVGFLGLGGVTDAPGIDVRVHGVIEAGASALADAAGTEMDFVYAQTLTPTMTEIDISVADKNPALYVRVTVVAGTLRIDALEATHDTCQ